MPDGIVPVRERGRLFLEGALPLQGRRLLLRRQEVSDQYNYGRRPRVDVDVDVDVMNTEKADD